MARWAAATARSTSVADAAGAVAHTSPVAGLIDSITAPSEASQNSPSM